MAELFGLVDCGATQTRVVVADRDMHLIGTNYGATDPDNYYRTIQGFSLALESMSIGHGELVSVSVAVAGELDKEGRIVRAGGLSPWVGRCISGDTAEVLGIPSERVGSVNDVEALGISQQHANRENGKPADGIVTTLSSGWGGARYTAQGAVKPDEPGHEYLREGAVCTCGQKGCAEAFISGKGVFKNTGIAMQRWLEKSDNSDQFVTDVSAATIGMIERHARDGFEPAEIRWIGGVAANQPLLMWRASEAVRSRFGQKAPVWDTVTLGQHAGLHGTFIDAQRRAREA
jgi:predicted NBD/HSP70 family sugar kinase